MTRLEQARQRSSQLRESAKEILNALDLETRLSHLGDFQLDGSYASDMMVKPDIDIRVVTANPDLRSAATFAQEMMLMPDVRRTMVTNYLRHSTKTGMPKGIYIGLHIMQDDVRWNVDIWVMRESERLDTANFPRGWFERLTNDQKDIIIMLKTDLLEAGRYPGEYHSADVYRAVMNGGVSSVSELEQWRLNNPYY